MPSSRAACCLSLLLFALGCTSEPAAADLSAGASVDATSARGLATGTLSIVGNLTTGANDFELILAPGNEKAARLESFTATMPAHGHLAVPDTIDASGGAYWIMALPLSMPGVWRLTGKLRVDGADDSIAFDVDVP